MPFIWRLQQTIRALCCSSLKRKLAKIDLSAYETKTNRKKLIKAYCEKFPVVNMFCVTEDKEYVMKSTSGRILLLNTGAIAVKTTKDSMGVSVMTLKKGIGYLP